MVGHLTRQTLIEDQITFESKGDVCAVELRRTKFGKHPFLRNIDEEDLRPQNFFINIQAWNAKDQSLRRLPFIPTIEEIETAKHYLYLKPEIIKELYSEISESSNDFYKIIKSASQESPIKLLNSSDFDPKNLIWIDYSCHLFYRFNNENFPISRPYYMDYICGVTNKDYKLKIAKKILKENPYVSNLKEIDIPYYNLEKDCNKALEFEVYLPQEIHDKIVKYYRDEIKEKYWAVDVKRNLGKTKPFDILGLKEALRKP